MKTMMMMLVMVMVEVMRRRRPVTTGLVTVTAGYSRSKCRMCTLK